MKGRALTELRKRAVLKVLLEAWLDAPELRLGQLIVAATHGQLAPLFYLEDDTFARALQERGEG